MIKKDRLLYEELYDKFGPTTFTQIKQVLDKARDDFFNMKKTDTINAWVAEWFVKYFGAKPSEDKTVVSKSNLEK